MEVARGGLPDDVDVEDVIYLAPVVFWICEVGSFRTPEATDKNRHVRVLRRGHTEGVTSASALVGTQCTGQLLPHY